MIDFRWICSTIYGRRKLHSPRWLILTARNHDARAGRVIEHRTNWNRSHPNTRPPRLMDKGLFSCDRNWRLRPLYAILLIHQIATGEVTLFFTSSSLSFPVFFSLSNTLYSTSVSYDNSVISYFYFSSQSSSIVSYLERHSMRRCGQFTISRRPFQSIFKNARNPSECTGNGLEKENSLI